MSSASRENAWLVVSLPIWIRNTPLPPRFALDVWWTRAPLRRTSIELAEPLTLTLTSRRPQVFSGRTPVVVLYKPLCCTYNLLPDAFWRYRLRIRVPVSL